MGRGRRVRGEGSIYQRSDGRWFYKVDLGWIGGRRMSRTVSASTKRELLLKKKALDDEVASGVTLSKHPTVAEWVTYWIDNVSSARESTKKGYRGYARVWIVPHCGAYRLDKLKPEHIRSMVSAMARDGKSLATQKQARAILAAALQGAVEDRKLVHSPAESVKAPTLDRTKHYGRLSLAEARSVIAELDDDPMASRWLAALLQGLRQGEALGLRWEDVDLEARQISIVRTARIKVGGGMTEAPLKSRTSQRVIPLLEPVAWALERLAHREGYVWGQAAKGDLTLGGEVARRPEGDHRSWERLLECAGVRDYPLHSARETTGSLLMEAGVPDVIIQEILGHAQVTITREAYIHGDDRLRREGMAALEALVFKAS